MEKSSPKPPELVDLEAQLMALSGEGPGASSTNHRTSSSSSTNSRPTPAARPPALSNSKPPSTNNSKLSTTTNHRPASIIPTSSLSSGTTLTTSTAPTGSKPSAFDKQTGNTMTAYSKLSTSGNGALSTSQQRPGSGKGEYITLNIQLIGVLVPGGPSIFSKKWGGGGFCRGNRHWENQQYRNTDSDSKYCPEGRSGREKLLINIVEVSGKRGSRYIYTITKEGRLAVKIEFTVGTAGVYI